MYTYIKCIYTYGCEYKQVYVYLYDERQRIMWFCSCWLFLIFRENVEQTIVAFTLYVACSKLTTEALEQGVKYVQS